MATANQELDWRDVEMRSPADSGVWRAPTHEPFPLVHRVDDPPARSADEPDEDLAFFARPPSARDTFDDLVDERVEANWHARRYRRVAVKTLATLAFGAVVAVAVLAARENPTARSAVTEWATLGAAR